jgi:hypothetical protein
MPTQPTLVPGLNGSTQTGPSNKTEDDSFLTPQSGEDLALLSKTSQTMWFWISLAFAALWLLTLGLWWRNRRVPINREEQSVDQVKPENTNKARKQFLSACNKNDPKLARQALLRWAAIHWPQSPPAGLDELALRLTNEEAGAALTELDRVLYQDKGASWDGQELARVIKLFPEQVIFSDKEMKLPDLYVRS